MFVTVSPRNVISPYVIKVTSFFLIAGLLVYPFSIAASNLFFGIIILVSLIYRDIFKQGWHTCWHQYKHITVGVILFISFTFIGSLWGPFTELAIHKMGKQLNWLIIPIIIGLVHFNPKLRSQAFFFISLGLFLHLILCTLQYYGIVTINGLGSSQHDATGLVGHLSFGFIYGIWAGALIVAAQNMPKPWKYFCYTLATYAVVTTFLAQGRSGYITTFVCLSLVIFKVLFPKQWKIKLVILGLLITSLSIFIHFHQPTKNKLHKTVIGVSSFLDGNWNNVDMRIKIWAVSIEIWKENPYFGVGTAGYPEAAFKLLQKPKYAYLLQNTSEGTKKVFYGHPHNEFLFELSRWGPLGLLALLYLCWHWLRAGWKQDWEHNAMTAYLFTASALSVIFHGLTEPSLNTQFETVFATIVLAFAMSKSKQPDSH